MNANVLETSRSYTNKLVGVTTRNNSRIFLRMPWFLLLKGFTDSSPIYPMTATPVKKPSSQKSLCLFTNILEVKKTAYRQVGAATAKRMSTQF